eukprot:364741-Chlamydomonas_euryale.AAC.7
MAHRGACDSAVHWPVYWQFTGMHNRRPTASNALCKHWKHRNSGLVWSLFSQGSTQAPSSKTSTSSLKKSTIHASGREPLTCGSCQSHTKPTSSHEFQLAGVPAANLPHSFLWPAFQCAIWHALQQLGGTEGQDGDSVRVVQGQMIRCGCGCVGRQIFSCLMRDLSMKHSFIEEDTQRKSL